MNRSKGCTALRAGILAVGLMGACQGKDTHPEEARALLTLLERLSPDASARERQAALKQLAALPLTHADLKTARERCQRAHTGLLEIQLLQAEARKHMAQATEAPEADRAASVAAAKAALSGAKEMLASARDEGDACHALTQALAEHYR